MNMANRHRPESSITSSIVSVGRGGGRGFVIEIPGQRHGRVPVTLRERMIVTAAHCLPSPPTPHPWAQDSRSWKLLAPLGERPSIVATCRFVDPVADIALIGSPDNQEMYEEAEAYEALTDAATALPIGFLPSKFAAELNGWLLSLDGAWFSCTVTIGQMAVCGPTRHVQSKAVCRDRPLSQITVLLSVSFPAPTKRRKQRAAPTLGLAPISLRGYCNVLLLKQPHRV
jgi:hypothetical protein